MSHETRIKVKKGDEFIPVEDLPAYRDYMQSGGEAGEKPMPAVVVSKLPDAKLLDPEVPLEQLFFEHPEIRRYITEDGRVRQGLPQEFQGIARDIIRKYDRLLDVETDLPDPIMVDPERPFYDLCAKYPRAQRYITESGTPQSGLLEEHMKVARAIIEKYRKRA